MQKILGNISLKRKLQLLTFLPILALIFFIFSSIYDSYNNLNTMNRLIKVVHIAEQIDNLVTNQSKERTYTVSFINSKGNKYHDEVLAIRKKTIDSYKKLIFSIQDSSIDQDAKKDFIKTINNLKRDLITIHGQITKENIANTVPTNSLNFYTRLNNDVLSLFLELSKYSDSSDITTQIIALYNLLNTKDETSLIRSYGVNLIDVLEDESEQMEQKLIYSQLRLKNLLSSSQQKLEIYLTIANEKNKNFFKSSLKKTKLDDYNAYVTSLANDQDLDLYEGESDLFYKLASINVKMYDQFNVRAIKNLNETIQNLKSSSEFKLVQNFMIGIILFALTVFLGLVIFKKISSDMIFLKNNLLDFFDFISKKKDDIDLKSIEGNDEFALLINTINQEVEKTKDFAKKDNLVLEEIDEVISRVENGFFTYNVTKEAGSDAVALLKDNVNNMINITKEKLDTLQDILEAYGQYHYDFKLDESKRKGMAGNIGTLSTSLLALGDDISVFMATFSNIVDELHTDTHTLLTSSKNLSHSSNTQAASLEQSAAALEQVTSSIQENANSTQIMLKISDQLKAKTDQGNTLANNTSHAMDEIVEKVNLINESITVIDQIAFQTNILSLNAAVEAATAGEAGKGFAVVAGEVRNLANRSSDAANEIKALVEIAKQKANEGKTVTTSMINGYQELITQIDETKDIIDNVSTASKEQRDSIVQINDAIGELDKMTQKNAAEASGLNKISSRVEALSLKIEDTIRKATFDNEYKYMVCDVNLASTVASYKRDHIKFKAANFERLNEYSQFSVVDCKSCRLGKWIIEQEDNGEKFTKSNEWNALKDAHEKVHMDVQIYVDKNAQHIPQHQLVHSAVQIENDTLEVFDKLNQLLKINCKM
jgi:methyl-accepting chemotaxis protein